ncbi:hypothetical protein ACLB2K_003828 [Fragaria x ananassa]
MDILITVVAKIAEYAVVPIIRQGGYIIHCKSNLHTLQTRLDELKATRGRMQNDIVAAERRGETIQPDVVLWMTESDKIIGKVEELLEDGQAKMKCLHGFCPNLRTRHQLSRKSTKLLEVVVEMNGRVFPSIACGGRGEEVFLVSAKDYGEFDSRISTVKGIIDELKNLDTNKIGVYGIGGVGKTTLAEEVVRQVIKDGLFEDVVMVRDVKENPDIGRLQKEIAEKLGERESWSLFESKAGDGVKDPDIQTVAAQVAKRCGGLPVLIVTVASSLRNTTLVEWKDALRRPQTFGKSGSTKEVFLTLEWSYDRLDDEELKSLFLLCGVVAWKNNIFLDDLFKFAMGLGLLKGVDTVDDAQNSLLTLVQKLKGFSLLLDHDDEEFVRMHDLVHDVANDIASRNGQLISVACGAEFKNWQKNSKCSKISTKSGSLAEVSKVLGCKKLEMLYLHSEDGYMSFQLPNSFFANMENLKVLRLRNVKINFTSLKFLKNLQAMCLKDCEVEDIALVGELRKFEILSLGSKIEQLPEEVGELSCLRLLDLTRCFSLNVIAPNVLSRLTRLEDLRMRNSSIGWEADDEGERRNASLSELKHLSLLTALEIHIPDPDMLPKDLFSEKFTTGDELDEGLKTLVNRSEELSLRGGDNVNESAYQLSEGEAFRKVKHLYLIQLDSTFIINSKVVFSSLTTLEVVACHGIKFLISSSVARSLDRCLSTVEKRNCGSMKEIVSVQEDDEENNMDNILSNLKSLTLEKLPSLVRLYAGSHAEFSSLEEVFNLGADNVVPCYLFNKKVIFPSLETLRLRKLPKLKAVWQNQLAPDSFCWLRNVTVMKCISLINLFLPCISERLDALEALYVQCCALLELPEVRWETVPKFVSPKVTELTFSNLPNLKSIYPGKHVSQWPSLQELEVDECGEVEIVAGELSICRENQESDSHSIQIKQPLILFEKGSPVFPHLEALELGAIEMWSGPVLPPAQFCPKLKSVGVVGATLSKHATFLHGLHNLETITVQDSENEDKHPCIEIFEDNEGNFDSGGEIYPLGILPQVKNLKIVYMYSLMHLGGGELSISSSSIFSKTGETRCEEMPRTEDSRDIRNILPESDSFDHGIS